MLYPTESSISLDDAPRFMGRVPDFLARIAATERLNNSTNGNPRYRVAFTNGVMAITSSDASISYDVANLARGCWYDDKEAPIVAVFLTRAGRIDGMVRVTDKD